MSTIPKTNLKRIRDILLADEHGINNDVNDDQSSDSDSESDFLATESDDTSNSEHRSEESDLSNSDFEQGDVVTSSQPETLKRNGVTWSMYSNLEQSRTAAANVMKKKAGPTIKIQTVLDAFKLFFTNEILDQIVLHTNLYAKRYYDKKIRPQQDSNNIRFDSYCWKPVDRIELESFIGLLIQSGVHRSNHELLNDLWDISRSCPLYRATMSLQRFKHLLQFIRFDDTQTRDKSDRLGPIRYIFDIFTKQLSKYYVPGENLTVDEQLVPFRGRCCFVQYMPSKPAKYGLKFWVLSDVDSRYVLSIDLYNGKKDNNIQKNLATGVVLKLVDRLPNNVKQGRCITFDRYFTDIKLCEALLDRKMTSIGVVDHRRSFLPDELKLCRKNLYSSWFYFSGQHMILSYQAKEKKKPIIILSSSHNQPEVFDDDKKVPCAIHDYNQTKYGVDVIDQCIGNYTVRRINRRWPMYVFFNMIDIAAINSMTIWLCHNSDWNNGRTNTRRVFLSQLSIALTDERNQRHSQQSRLKPKVKLALLSLGYKLRSENVENSKVHVHLNPSKKRCYLCPSKPGRKVRQFCYDCGNNVCLSHSTRITTVTCQRCQEKN